ncbi:MAG TPA: hypothetical protein VFO12_10915 [Sphingomicrobium sp.]|nr:hypothetical protein [Sphingomicrobium sp.]
MNPAIHAAIIAATHQEGIEKKIEGRLKKARALGPASAIALDLEGKDRDLIDHAIVAGTVKRTSDGRLYLHEQAVADRKEGQGFMVVLIVLVMGSLIASAAVLATSAGG